MKTWPQQPSKSEVEGFLKELFEVLRAGDLASAKTSVSHAFDDWDQALYTTWQDHYLIHESPPDSSFEGGEWKTNLAWLKDLTIGNVEWVGQDSVWLDFVYRGEPSGYTGEFQVKPNDDGSGYHVERVAFRMA